MAALKALLADISEVDEKYRDLYTERNGKWEFTGVEGLKTQADIDRQLAANQKVRGDLTKAQGDLKIATDKLATYEGLDPEDVRARLDELETLKAGNSVPELAKNFQATVESRVAQLLDGKVKAATSKLERQLAEVSGKVTELTTSNASWEVKDQQRTIADAVQAVAIVSKVIPSALPDLVATAGRELKIVDGKVQTEDGRDAAAWLADRKEKTPFYWPQAQGAGGRGGNDGGTIDGENPFRREGWNQTKIGRVLSADPAKAAKLAEQAGVPKDDAGNFRWHVMPPAPAAK